jgi:phage shock protein A
MGIVERIFLFVRVRVSAMLDRSEDPRQTLDYAHAQQQELLRQVRQGMIEVATSKRLLEQQAQRLGNQVPHAENQAARAIAAEREDLARIALQRKQTAMAELTELEARLAEVTQEERKLGLAEQQLAARVEEFRIRRASLSARYAAAEAQTRVLESLTGVSRDFAQLGAAIGRAEERIERMQARATAIDALIDTGSLVPPGSPLDPVESELRKLSANQAVEHELAALRERVAAEPTALLPGEPTARPAAGQGR